MASIAKLLRLLVVPAYWRGLRHGVAAGVEHGTLLETMKMSTVVDIGANRGQFSLIARRCFPRARILAFEPLPGPGAKFSDVFVDDERVTLNLAAIGPTAGQMPLHVSRSDDSSSLLPITDRQSNLFPGTEEERVTGVAVAPLSDFLNRGELSRPALLKLDVQGFELEALKGCESLLGAFDAIYVECSFVELYRGQALLADVVDWLHDRGFRLHGAYNLCYDSQGLAVQGDFLFLPE